MDLASRRPGPDVVRAVAMFGVVVMNYHGYLILKGGRREGGWLYSLFDPWAGPLSNRFAATFVLTAGVGVSLMTRIDHSSDMRWRLVRRGLLLYGVGLLFDMVWPGTILTYYGVMFVLAAGLLTVPSWALASVGIVAATIGATFNPARGGFRSPLGLVVEVMFHGTHPLFPWLIYFTAGMIVGRQLSRRRSGLAIASAGAAFLAFAIVSGWSNGESLDPPTRTLTSSIGALGVALLAFAAISTAAERWSETMPVDALRRAGQLSLSIYLVHALAFNLVVDWLDLVQPGGLATSLPMATVTWSAATAGAVTYQRRRGRGPAETVYRRLTV